MQLAQKVNQQLLNRYIGGEAVVENGTVLVKGTTVGLTVQGDLVVASLMNTSWKKGTLNDIDAGKWSDTTPRATSVLLSMTIESANDNVLFLSPSPRDTKAQLSPRVR